MTKRALAFALLLSIAAHARSAHAGIGRLVPDPAKRAYAAAKRGVNKQLLFVAAKAKLGLDRLEQMLVDSSNQDLASRLTVFRRSSREWSPLRMAAFAAHELKRDPLLIPAYAAASWPLDVSRAATATWLGHAHGTAFYLATAIPTHIASLVTAAHGTAYARAPKDDKPSLGETIRSVRKRYDDYGTRQDRRIERAAAKLAR